MRNLQILSKFLLRESKNPSKSFRNFSAISKVNENRNFKWSDYEVIGFDFDNTLVDYKKDNFIKLIYESWSRYLCDQKNYSKKYLRRPLEGSDLDFLEKGLILDLKRGNVMRAGNDGEVLVACHGTRLMSESEVVEIYGADKKWEFLTRNDIAYWNMEFSEEIRITLDYFDASFALLFARIVDSIDCEKGGPQKEYNLWKDIIEGMRSIFGLELFQKGTSPFYEAFKKTPDDLLIKTDEKVLELVESLKKSRNTFLLTGSYVDFVDLVGNYTLGKNWKEFFDVTLVFAQKPGFFTYNRPFREIQGYSELSPVKSLQKNQIYSRGNFKDLQSLFENRKILYVGDNMVSDIHSPHKFHGCSTLALSEEAGFDTPNSIWDNYFHFRNKPTLWTKIIENHSVFCVSSLVDLSGKSLDFEFGAGKS